MTEIKLSVTGHAKLMNLAHALKEAGEKELTKELRKGLRDAAKPAVTHVQAAIRSLPVHGVRGKGSSAREAHQRARRPKARSMRSTGLRDSIARGIKAQSSIASSAGLKIRTSVAELPPDQRKLPRYLDSNDGWRHPVFGNRKTWQSLQGKKKLSTFGRLARTVFRLFRKPVREIWVEQYGQPWFGETLKKEVPNVRKEMLEAMDVVAAKIAKG